VGDLYRAWGDKRSPETLGRRIEALATRQGGVVSRSQLLQLGLSPDGIARRHARRELIRLHQGVYAVGHRRLTSRARELAAVISCGPDALLSHRSAGSRHGLLRSTSPRIEVSVPRGRRSRPGIVVHRRRVLGPDNRVVLEDIPMTSVARTIVDLASSPELGRMLDAAERAATRDVGGDRSGSGTAPDAARTGSATPSAGPLPFRARLYPQRGRAAVAALCRRHGLPMPQVNLWIEGYEIDFFWADAALAVEVDGRAFHSGTRAFHDDRRRDRALLAAGIQTARVTWADLLDPSHLADELRQIRAARLVRSGAPRR